MGVKNHYSGLCSFGAENVEATVLAYAGLRVNPLTRISQYTGF